MSELSKFYLVIKNIISSYYKIFILPFSLIVKSNSNIILKLICFKYVNLTRTRTIPTTNKEKPIPNNPLEWIKPIPAPKKDMMKLTRYKSIMPIVAEKSINLKFSVGLIIPLL